MWEEFFKQHHFKKQTQKEFLRFIKGAEAHLLPSYVDKFLRDHYVFQGLLRLEKMLSSRYDVPFANEVTTPFWDYRTMLTRQSVTDVVIQAEKIPKTTPKEAVKKFLLSLSPKAIEQEKINQVEIRVLEAKIRGFKAEKRILEERSRRLKAEKEIARLNVQLETSETDETKTSSTSKGYVRHQGIFAEAKKGKSHKRKHNSEQVPGKSARTENNDTPTGSEPINHSEVQHEAIVESCSPHGK